MAANGLQNRKPKINPELIMKKDLAMNIGFCAFRVCCGMFAELFNKPSIFYLVLVISSKSLYA